MASFGEDDSLSDASLIEDEDSAAGAVGGANSKLKDANDIGAVQDDSEDDDASSIHLQGEPVTQQLPETPDDGTESEEDEESGFFHGFRPENVTVRPAATPVSVVDSKWMAEVEQLELVTFNFSSIQPPVKTAKVKTKPVNVAKTPSSSSRPWKPSAQFFKPLVAGWKREVVYGREAGTGEFTAKPLEIVYHAPPIPGTKAKQFRTIAELGQYLTNSSNLTLHNFSFRKDPMNAPADQEIIRAFDEEVVVFPPVEKEKKKPANEPGFSHHPPPSNPLLKVKMFSKMKEKNAHDSSESQESSFVAKHRNLPASTAMPQRSSHVLQRKMGQRMLSPHHPQKSVLRPNNMDTSITCSIHCQDALGPPALSCANCHTMFHPVCVGLMEGPDYNGFDFHCANCPPPPGRDCVEMPPPVSPQQPRKKIEVETPLPKKQPFVKMPSIAQRISMSPPVSQGFGSKKAKGRSGLLGARKADERPLRPIESQAVINVAGTKYLVVPHPTAKKARVDKESSLLPLLLKPCDASAGFPDFAIEESPDGRLILKPDGDTSKLPIIGKENGKKSVETKPKKRKTVKTHFPSSLSNSYFALVKVFEYLAPSDVLKAAQVSRLWREAAHHRSLWKVVTLKGCKVRSWTAFARHLLRTETQVLDLRKIKADAPEETWERLVEVAPAFHSLKKLILPKMSAKLINRLVVAVSKSPLCQLEAVAASQIVNSNAEPLDVEEIVALPNIKCVKVKSHGGELVVKDLEKTFEALQRKRGLIELSLTSIKTLNLRHVESIMSLENLTSLELGDATTFGDHLFPKLNSMQKLRHVRIEKGSIGPNIGALEHLGSLESLELIGVDLAVGFGRGFIKLQQLKQLLLIPHYTDEVATVNSEIVDSILSMGSLIFFKLGLTNEWLESMGSLLNQSSKDNFPIMVNGVCEMFSLTKLFKTLTAALPAAQVKILKMPSSAATKQSLR